MLSNEHTHKHITESTASLPLNREKMNQEKKILMNWTFTKSILFFQKCAQYLYFMVYTVYSIHHQSLSLNCAIPKILSTCNTYTMLFFIFRFLPTFGVAWVCLKATAFPCNRKPFLIVMRSTFVWKHCGFLKSKRNKQV